MIVKPGTKGGQVRDAKEKPSWNIVDMVNESEDESVRHRRKKELYNVEFHIFTDVNSYG